MTEQTTVKQQEIQVKKIIESHGFDLKGIDYSLHSILVLKAMQNGAENPYKWATEQIENLNSCGL